MLTPSRSPGWNLPSPPRGVAHHPDVATPAAAASYPAQHGHRRRLLCFLVDAVGQEANHRHVAYRCLAERIAQLMQMEFVGDRELAGSQPGRSVYVVPHDSIERDTADRWRVHQRHHLFGGVVPHAFVASKAIVHPRISADAAAPAGWSDAFAEQVRPVVLEGFTAFDRESLAVAARRLLQTGPVRLKEALGSGGRSQYVVADHAALREQLDRLDADTLRRGVLVEPQLQSCSTLSVGQVHLAGVRMSYCGIQHNLTLPCGTSAYAGSELFCVRGGMDVLQEARLPHRARLAITQAWHFHRSAQRHFPGLLISRANYDVIVGTTLDGAPRSGVLEQSWRIGGASGAEIEAVRLLAEDPRRTRAAVRTVECYDSSPPPPGAWVTYRRGSTAADPTEPQLKYVQVMDDVIGW